MCPACRIELVEADNSANSSLYAAVDRAVALGAKVVSMSWGGSESSSETGYDAHFNVPGVTFVASSGDDGYGVSYPAASRFVLAVGGTRLSATANGRTTETAWTDAGSGCSAYEAKPSWQHDASCATRTVTDVSADANPSTGAAIYTSTGPGGAGWMEVGGTSLAAPLMAGMVALSGSTNVASHLYAALGSANLYDVHTGTNGSCDRLYLCGAKVGYDGPTGVGALNGLAALR